VPAANVIRGSAPNDIIFHRSGYGDGSGSGSGDGSGYGYGSGSGSGYGYGSGDGYGYGYGDGDGYGYGDSYGSGDGDGSGYGYGDGEYWLATIDAFASKWPATLQRRLAELRKSGAPIAFWRSDANGQPSNNGGKIEAAAPGVIHTSSGPLCACQPGTLHATVIPPKWQGSRWWIVAMIGDVVTDGDKLGALKREIIGECL
jgi:hypothetical protein